MATYVYDRDRGIMVDKATREPMVSGDWTPATPLVVGDTPGYASPIDGAWIEGRRARRYDMEKHNCVDANDLGSATGGKLKNEKFARKHGLEHLLK
ncbi:MAG: hypothetical protein RL268_483 [Pseudomonadota bacterium]|jgi:hypothetical protein